MFFVENKIAIHAVVIIGGKSNKKIKPSEIRCEFT